MPNVLTGDFEAVLQVGNGTFNRLVATMHQNGFVDQTKPSLPHTVYFRLGESDLGEGVRGSVAAQVGAPHVVLLHGATKRFRVNFGFRARYRADPGTVPLADVIHGEVSAEYRIEAVDPNCAGWHAIAGDYLWMRVVEDSVRFDGVAYSDTDSFTLVPLPDDESINARIVRLLESVLRTQFEPVPQQIGKRFRRMRCLAIGDAPGQAAVAIPFGMTNEIPSGNLASINDLFLEGRDFGLAVSSDFIMTTVQPHLDPIVGLQRDFHIHGDAGIGGGLEIDYHARVDSIDAQWLGPSPFGDAASSSGLIRIAVTGSGWATRLYRSGVYNIGSVHLNDLQMSFAAHQLLMLDFDPIVQRLTVAPLGGPEVSVIYGGPYAGEVKRVAHERIASQVQANIAGALDQARTALGILSAPERKSALLEQLRLIDSAADARFDEAVFRGEGVVLRGTISLSNRHAPHVSFEINDAGDGFDGIETWIPGGRIDRFDWTWRWFTNQVEEPPSEPGSASETRDFLLRRPHGLRSKYGLATEVERPLPGLDGHGKVCLSVRGVRVDPASGALVPVFSEIDCTWYFHEFKLPSYEIGPYARICDPLRASITQPAPEVGILRVGVPDTPTAASNTLALYLNRDWDDPAVAALAEGLDACRRENAGLLALLIFEDGALAEAGSALKAKIAELRHSLPCPLVVNEDVRQGWSLTLGFPADNDEPAWRLISPTGVVAWAEQGYLKGSALACVLDERLVTSRPPAPTPVRPGIGLRKRVPFEVLARPCPPPPLARPWNAKLVFVHKTQIASLGQLVRESSKRDDQAPFIAVVIDGASAEEAESLHADPDTGFAIFGDPDGAITRRAGVRLAPTAFILDYLGRLDRFEPGFDLGEHAAGIHDQS
ncbi:thioredoxin domain-containing protein [Streptomyces mirabilis]|uniref:hypothetical protein n=1 Tax=Streptomyces mirabilis TaxID=68239 RepID=UPI003653EF61